MRHRISPRPTGLTVFRKAFFSTFVLDMFLFRLSQYPATQRRKSLIRHQRIRRYDKRISACRASGPPLDPTAETWPSGRRRSPAKGVGPKGSRGFESHRLRHHFSSSNSLKLSRIPSTTMVFCDFASPALCPLEAHIAWFPRNKPVGARLLFQEMHALDLSWRTPVLT